MKPELVLHPGFPKCGTTSLQKLFIINEHAFAKQMNLGFIGAGFKANNGYPPVSQIMYNYQDAVASINNNSYVPGRYFLSNEAIIGKSDFLSVLAEKFRISRAVFTLRHPVLQGLSNYRYSGWLKQDLASFLSSQGDWLYNTKGKYLDPIRTYMDLGIPVRLCPIEKTEERFEARFLREAFDEVPSLLNEAPFSTLEHSNASVPFAFAEAIHNVLFNDDFKIPTGTDRHALVIAAQQYKLPDELRRLLPSSISMLNHEKLDASLNSYSLLLREFDIDEKIHAEVIGSSRKQVDALLGQPVASSLEKSALSEHAYKLLEQQLRIKGTSVNVKARSLVDTGKNEIALPIAECKVGNSLRPMTEGKLKFSIIPSEQQIFRLQLTGGLEELKASTVLCFDFHSPNCLLKPDIVEGDEGYPSIILVNSEGVHFKFARGNLKDFFDISRPNTPQRIELPLSAFLYDKDMVTNSHLKGGFFEKPVVKIIFDFLRHGTDTVDIELGNFAYRNISDKKTPPVQDLVIFDRSDQVRSLPKFATERGGMSFWVALNATGIALGYSGARLKLEVIRNGIKVHEVDVCISEENINLQLQLKKRGFYRLRAELSKNGKTLAYEEWSACHVIQRDGSNPSSLLGISDGAEYDRIAMAGGSWDRLVVPLALVVKDEAGFRFQSGLNAFPRTRRQPSQHRILSIFQMPKEYSRLAERWDYSRYGPSDLVAYSEMIGWLAKSAYDAGFTHIEVWNEASAYGHWNDDMDALITLHKITYDAVRNVAPDMVVLGGCTHSWDFDFLHRFFESGGAEYCDGLSIHGYTYQPELAPKKFDELESLIGNYVSATRSFGVYVTEVGFRMPAFTEISAAENLVLFTLEASSRERTRSVVWFRYYNPRPEVDSGYQQRSSSGYALVGNGDRYCRASYAAYRFIDKLLGCSNEVRASGCGEERVYRLIKESDTVALVVKSRKLLEEMAPKGWQGVDVCGGPLSEGNDESIETPSLFIALRADFFK